MSGCVQGMEVAIVSDLIMSGALAHIDNVHVDWPLFTLSDKVAAHYLLDMWLNTEHRRTVRVYKYIYCLRSQDKLSSNGSEVNLMYDERNDKFR